MAIPKFGYPGSKARLAQTLASYMPQDRGLHFVDVFAGRGNVYFEVASRRMFARYTLNDLYLRFCQAVRDLGPFIDRIDWRNSREEFKFMREWSRKSREATRYARALGHRTADVRSIPDLVDAVMCWSGGTWPQGRSGSKTRRGSKGFVMRVKAAAEMIWATDTVIVAHGALGLLEKFSHAGQTFIYLDPPYCDADVGDSYHPLRMKEYKEMVNLLLRAKCRWMLSEYEHPVYRPLTEKFGEPLRIPTRVLMSSMNGKKQRRVECVWTNYPRQRAKLPDIVPLVDKGKGQT